MAAIPGEGAGPAPMLGMGWTATAAVMLGDMFGLGQLTLPQTYARLGWLPGSLLIVCFCILTLYSARLYTRLALACPDASMFDQVAHRALGRLGTGLVWASCYISVLLCPIIFQITCSEALKQVLYQWPVSTLHANLVVAALILPLAQFQDMEGIAAVSLVGTLGQVVAIVVVIGKLATIVWQQQRDGLPAPPTHMAGAASYPIALVGVMDVLFCYGGQPNWWRYIICMSDRSKFVQSSCLAVSFMTIFYVSVAIVGYVALGDSVDVSQALTSLLAADMWTAIMNAGLFMHCLFAYQININVWASSVLELVGSCCNGYTTPTPEGSSPQCSTPIKHHEDGEARITLPIQCDAHVFACHVPLTDSTAPDSPSQRACRASGAHSSSPQHVGPLPPSSPAHMTVTTITDDLKAPLLGNGHGNGSLEDGITAAGCSTHAHGTTSKSSITWALLTCLCILACMGASIMFQSCFSTVMAVISASGDAMSLVGLPCLFSLYLVRDLPTWERHVCWLAVVGAVVLSGLGMVSSCQQLIAAYHKGTGQ